MIISYVETYLLNWIFNYNFIVFNLRFPIKMMLSFWSHFLVREAGAPFLQPHILLWPLAFLSIVITFNLFRLNSFWKYTFSENVNKLFIDAELLSASSFERLSWFDIYPWNSGSLRKLSVILTFSLSRNHSRTQRKSAKTTEKISKTLGVDFEKVDFKIIIF